MTSVVTILNYLDANLAMWQPWGHVTSSMVAKCFCQKLGIEKCYSTMHGLIVFSSSRRIEWYTFWPWGHVNVAWPEVNWIPWPYEVIIYIFRCVSTREYRWCHCHCSSLVIPKVIGKKLPCSQVPQFWFVLPLWRHLLPNLKMTRAKIVDLIHR